MYPNLSTDVPNPGRQTQHVFLVEFRILFQPVPKCQAISGCRSAKFQEIGYHIYHIYDIKKYIIYIYNFYIIYMYIIYDSQY